MFCQLRPPGPLSTHDQAHRRCGPRASKPGLYGDGDGLYLQVSAFDTKAWVFRYMIDGRPRKMGLCLSTR